MISKLTVDEYIEKYKKGEKLDDCSGLCARILRSKDEFPMLSDTPGKQLAWIFGDDGLKAISGKGGWDLMRVNFGFDKSNSKAVGYDQDWVNVKLKQGFKFKLAIFPSVDCVLADWRGVFFMLESTYPDVWPSISPHSSDLQSLSYDEIQNLFSEFNIKEVNLLGRTDSRYMNFAKFRALQNPSLGQVRAFLYHEIGLTFLYSGQGHTVIEHTLEKGLSEYLTKNRPISEIKDLQFIDIEINQI